MKAWRAYIILFTLITLISCRRDEEVVDARIFPPIIKASGYVVPGDSIKLPDTLKIKSKGGYQAKLTSPVPIKTNQSIIPVSLKMSKLVTTPRRIGTGEYREPKVVEFTEQSTIVGSPKQVLVKEPLYKEINPGSFFYFNKMQGLLHDQIRALAQDSIGNIWIGTDNGLSRYDGKHYYHYTSNQGLANNLINYLFIDSKKNIWISTYEEGVTKFDGTSFTKISSQDGLPHDLVNCIFEDRYNRIWFGTRRGLVMYEKGKLTIFTTESGLSANDVRSIIDDNSGRMWIATYGGGISIYDGETFSLFTTKEGLVQDHISMLFKDSHNNIWISTAFMGLIKYDGRALTSYTTREGLGNNSIRSILEDRDGNMWFGNSNGNITRFDGTAMRVYGKNDGLVAEAMRSSLQDMNGNLWFGTRGAGLVRFEGRLFSHYTEQEGLSSSRITSINEDHSGNLWISTFGGFVNILSEGISNGIKRQYIRVFGPEAGLTGRFIFNTTTDYQGRLWISTDNQGLLMYDGARTYIYDESGGLPDKTIVQVDKDNEGNIWFSSMRSGISKIIGETIITFGTQNGISHNHVRCFLQDSRSNIWFGTAGGGLTKYDGKSYTHFNKKHGFFTDTINDILEDNRGIIWFASGGNGLIRYDGDTFIRYSEESGLKSKVLMSLIQDKKGSIWIGTRFGLHEIKQRVHESIDSLNRGISINSFGIEQGFMGMECRKESLFEASDGTIWIGTEDRLTAYHGGSSIERDILPSLKITKVQLFNEDIDWSDIYNNPDSIYTLNNGIKLKGVKLSGVTDWYLLPKDLTLKRGTNYISFNFIATTHSQTKSIKYQYMLEGLDKGWSSPTERTEASYGHLNSGRYTLRVKSVTSEGLESKETTFSFRIRQSWWETSWFHLTILLFTGFLLYRIYRLKIKDLLAERRGLVYKLEEKNTDFERSRESIERLSKEREKIFSIISQDLKGPISKMIGSSKNASSLNDLLDNLLMWSAIQQGKIIFSPESSNITDIINQKLDSLLQQAKEKEISIINKIPRKLDIEADPRLLKNILGNLISNAIKFTSRGGDILIKADSSSPDEIKIIIEDNGIGMNQDIINSLFELNVETGRTGTEGEPSTGLGLLISKNLIEIHSGKIEIFSEIKKGSRVIVTLPKTQPGI